MWYGRCGGYEVLTAAVGSLTLINGSVTTLPPSRARRDASVPLASPVQLFTGFLSVR